MEREKVWVLTICEDGDCNGGDVWFMIYNDRLDLEYLEKEN